MIGKKINQLATELAPVSTDLTIIGDPISGVSKKITLAQLGAIFSGAVSFYTNLAGFPATGDINVIYCAKDTQKLYLWNGSAYTEVFPAQALLDTYQLRSEKGVSNGYASLDSSGKVPISQLPSSIMEYKGTWNAATNTPTLANGTGDTGDVYICNVAGTVNFGAGPITFAVGDYVIYSGSIWQRSSGAVGTVTSVAASITGNAIGITGSPVTTSGTLAFAFAGTGAQYIKGDGTLATFPSTIAQAERLITEVYNSTGATLTKGTIVYINGGQGNLPTVTKALATGDSTSAQTFGVVQADITNNNNGYVVVAGKLSDLDTQAYTEGTQLYLSATTAGTWTSTKQYAPNHLVYVGIVVRAHPTQGIVEIKIQNGYELDELHDVAAQNPDNNDILQYKTSTSLWTKVAGTTSNIAEGSNLYYTDARSRAALSFTAGSGAYNSTTGVITIPTNTNQLTNGAAYITLASLSAGAGISYNNTTGVIASTITQYTDAMARASISLTTTGTSGAATYNSTTGVLNVPQYAPDLSGYVPTSRTLTINGTAFDLSANRSWSVGTVTSVGLSSATSGVTIGSTPVTTSGTITLAIATASGSQQGLLSSTDWTTFNNKQNALTNPVTGTGTTNYLPKFTGTSTIGNSIIQEASGSIGINVSPVADLQVGKSSDVVIAMSNSSSVTSGNRGGIAWYNSSVSTVANIRAVAVTDNVGTQLEFYTRPASGSLTQVMTLSSTGNLGLGVTPSAWGTFTALQVGNAATWSTGTNNSHWSSNTYYDGTNRIYIGSDFATEYAQQSGAHKWFTAPSGTAGGTITTTQAMTLTSGGNVLINKTNDEGYKLDVNGATIFRGTAQINGYQILNGGSSAGTSTFIDFRNNGTTIGYVGSGAAITGGAANSIALGVASGAGLTIASTGAATFSSSVGVGGAAAINTFTVRAATNNNLDVFDNGTGVGIQAVNNINTAYRTLSFLGSSLSFTGAATFSSTIQATRLGVGNNVSGFGDIVLISNANANVYPRVDRSTTSNEAGWKYSTGGSDNWYIGLRGADNTGSYHFYSYTTNTSVAQITSGGTLLVGTTSNPYSLGAFVVNHNSSLSRTYLQRGVDLIEFIPSDGTAPNQISSSFTSSGSAYKPLTLSARQNNADLYLATNGNVGIGTPSPASILNLKSSTTTELRLESVAGTYRSFIGFRTDGQKWDVGVNLNDTNDALSFNSVGTERMRITSGGLIFYKGSSTTTNAEAVFENTNSLLSIESSASGSVSKAIRFNTSDGATMLEKMRITGGGNVGIGVTNPSEKLHLRDTTNGYVGLRLEGNGNYAGSDWTIYASSLSAPSANDFLGFYNNSTTDSATAEYKFRLFKTGVAEFVGDVKVKTLEVTNATTYGSSGGISTYMQITVNGNNYVIPLHQTP